MAVINKITYNVPDTMTTSHVGTGWGRRMPKSLPVILRGIYLTDSSNAQAEILSQASQIAELSKAKQYWS